MCGNCEFDIVVVGGGMIGSSLAKYLVKENEGLRVALVGPGEEADRTTTDIHGAFYDEGRMTRVLDPDPVWAVLAKRSEARFRQIEEESGIPFYSESGFLYVGVKDGSFINRVHENGHALSLPVQSFSTSDLIRKYPYIRFADQDEGAFTVKNSGCMNPRAFVKAQLKLAQKHGCRLMDTIADEIKTLSPSKHEVVLANGRTLTTGKVILATGAFTNFRRLLPDKIEPSIKITPNTVLLVELDEEEREAMGNLSPIIYRGGQKDKNGKVYSCYAFPPTKYPDGKYYLKFGNASSDNDVQLYTPKEIHRWICHGREENGERRMLELVKDFFPGLKAKRHYFDYAVTSKSAHNFPYVTMLTSTIGVALPGCGQAAKSCDEIGLMAARMIQNGHWCHDLQEEKFAFVAKTTESLEKRFPASL